MRRLSATGALSSLAFLFGFSLVGLSAWVVAGFHANPPQGEAFGAGLAYFGTYALGAVGVAGIGFALVISPARADGGGLLTVGRRQRQLSGAGLTVLVASLVAPVVAIQVTGIVNTILTFLGLVATGTLLVVVALLWTVSEAVLIRAGVVG